jgi:hypothetical protein
VTTPNAMTDLSPAARAVHSAFHKAANGQAWTNTAIAAALRAAADQVCPIDFASFTGHVNWDQALEAKTDSIRDELLAIADELDNNQSTREGD